MSSLKEQIEALKEQRIQEIINDTNLTKLEKLKLLADENLFEIKSYIQDDEIFKDWQEELTAKVKAETKRDRALVDSFLSPSENDFDRNSTLYLYDIEYLLADLIEDHDEDYDGDVLDYPNPIPVITARSSELTIDKTPAEVLDKIYEWAIANKICGYKIDW